MQVEVAWLIKAITIITIIMSYWTMSAIAQYKTAAAPECKPIYSTGLEDGGREFHAYSVCLITSGNFTPKYKLKYKVCAPTSRDLGFRWHELRWVSGSEGVPPGTCMNSTIDSNNFRILENSTLHTTRGDGRLGIYMPFSTEEGRFVAVESDIAGGTVTPYLVRIEAQAGYDGGSFDVRLVGKDVELIVLLPPTFENANDLVQQGIISQGQLDAFKDKIVSASEYMGRIISDESKEFLRNYADKFQFKDRLAIPIPVTDGVALQTFNVEPGQIKDINTLFDMLVCVSVSGKLSQCLGIPRNGGH